MSNSVTAFELAVLVLAYLDKYGYRKTATSFKREAKAFFKAARSTTPAPRLRDLLELLNDYVLLKEREQRRLALAGRNPLAGHILEVLEAEADEQQAAVTVEACVQARKGAAAAAAQQVTAAAHQACAHWLQEQTAATHRVQHGGAGAGAGQLQQHFVPVGQAGRFDGRQAARQLYGEPQPSAGAAAAAAAAGAAAGLQQVTPGRQRKGMPHKRRRTAGSPGCIDGLPSSGPGAEGDAMAADGGGWGSPMDILNLELDAEGLEALLDDGPLQLRFAENLAQHINENLGGGTHGDCAHGRQGAELGGGAADAAAAGADDGQAGGLGGAGSPDSSGFLAELLADPHMLLAELPADPLMAEVLQMVVRPSAASPTLPAKPASHSSSAAVADQRQQEAAAAVVVVAAAGLGRQRQKRQRPTSRASRAAVQHQHQLQQQTAVVEAALPIVLVEAQPAPVVQQADGQQSEQAEQQPEQEQQVRRDAAQAEQAMQADGEPQVGDHVWPMEQQQQQVEQRLHKEQEQGIGCDASSRDAAGATTAEPPAPAPFAAAPGPRSQQVLLDSGLLAAGRWGSASTANSPAAMVEGAFGQSISLAVAAMTPAAGAGDVAPPGNSRAMAAAAAAERLNAGLEGLGPLVLPASDGQLLLDIDDMFEL